MSTLFNLCKYVTIIIMAAAFGFYMALFFYQPQSYGQINVQCQYSSRNNSMSTTGGNHGLSSKDRLLLLALKRLAAAHRHARSSKTITELTGVYGILQNLLSAITDQSLSLGPNLAEQINFQKGNLGKKVYHVCPEIWMGMRYGYPFYYEGYILGNCSYGQPISKLVTVLLDATKLKYSQLRRYLDDLTVHHKGISVHVITPFTNMSKGDQNTVRATYHNVATASGKTWNELVSAVKTPYTLIARDSQYFDSNARLHRLVRMVNYLDVDVAGGSHRNSTGHWKIGCFQHKMLNYEYRIAEGYDLSFNSCIHCDYISGPFVAKTDYLVKNPFDASMNGEFVFLDFFYQGKKSNIVSVICPDAMFHTQTLASLTGFFPRKDWFPFVAKWELNYVTLPSGHKLHFTCAESKQTCSFGKGSGRSNPPCCNQILSDALWYFFQMCEKHNIGAETDAGTVVGGVKLYKTLPWELDADFNYRTSDHTKIKKLIRNFRKAGYTLSEDTVPKNCPSLNDSKNVNCGYFSLRKSPWRLEAWGTVRLAGDILQVDKIPYQTKMLIDGHWIITYPNPALFSRNHYSDDIFKHVEHWMTLGHSSGWVPYVAGSWMKCSKPGHHSCLDQYFPSGNLQFDHVWL